MPRRRSTRSFTRLRSAFFRKTRASPLDDAPLGQIVDRHGEPLAQTRVSYNLAVSFPTPLQLRDQDVGPFVQRQASVAQSILGRVISVSSDQALKHYRNRGVLPFVIAQDLR